MRMLHMFLAILAAISLSACSVTQVKGKIGGVKVEVTDEHSEKEAGHFCPPGQAKKGNC